MLNIFSFICVAAGILFAKIAKLQVGLLELQDIFFSTSPNPSKGVMIH